MSFKAIFLRLTMGALNADVGHPAERCVVGKLFDVDPHTDPVPSEGRKEEQTTVGYW
jgi:hypothetical protein